MAKLPEKTNRFLSGEEAGEMLKKDFEELVEKRKKQIEEQKRALERAYARKSKWKI